MCITDARICLGVHQTTHSGFQSRNGVDSCVYFGRRDVLSAQLHGDELLDEIDECLQGRDDASPEVTTIRPCHHLYTLSGNI